MAKRRIQDMDVRRVVAALAAIAAKLPLSLNCFLPIEFSVLSETVTALLLCHQVKFAAALGSCCIS